MSDDSHNDSTRRRFLQTGTGLTTAALLAGCLGGSGTGDGTPTDDPTSTAPPETTAGSTTESTTEESTDQSGPYSVTMEPVGTVEFESVPETWVANNGSWADMGVALGLEPPKGLRLTCR